jgi:hypothetical protein
MSLPVSTSARRVCGSSPARCGCQGFTQRVQASTRTSPGQWASRTMQAVAAVVPASHVFEGMRAVIAGQGVDAGSLAAAAVLDLAYVAAPLWFFHRMLGAVRRSGGLSRFAE